MKISELNINGNTNIKMGSRRIFTPQFKLQVLESYRNDSDCKGNQRATARKYNIHRRQIQKWLQCESILRTTVANSNENNVKHQLNCNYLHKPTNPSINDHYTTNFIDSHHQNHSDLKNCNDSTQLNFHLKTSKMPALCTGEKSSKISPQTKLTSTTPYLCASTISPIRSGIEYDIERNLISSTHNHFMPYTHTGIAISVPVFTHVIPHQYHYQYENLPHIQPLQAKHSIPYSITSENIQLTNLSDNIINQKKFESADTMIKSEKLNDNSLLGNRKYPIFAGISHYQNENNTLNCSINKYRNKNSYMAAKMTPIDLSLGMRQKIFETHKKINQIYSKDSSTTEHIYQPTETNSNGNLSDNSIVDLTLRKRKKLLINEIVFKNENTNSKILAVPTITNSEHSIEKENKTDDKMKIVEKSFSEKPIKLFKPYLLGEDENKRKKTNSKHTGTHSNDQQDTIIWSNHPECMSSYIYESEHDNSRDINFQLNNFEKATSENEFFHGRKSITSSIFSSPTAIGLSSNMSQCCKESPVSGYESCSSTYSESSSKSESFTISNKRAYSIDLQMETIYNISSQHMNVRNWLDQDSKKNFSSSSNNSIMLYS